MYSSNKCIGCCACVDNCSEFACTLTKDGIITDKSKCKLCLKCAEVCPTTATEISGRTETTANILNILQKETVFMDSSGGGVTFSGGEPLLQPKFLFELLEQCGKRAIHRAVDTAGFIKTELLLECAKRADLFLYDLKMMDTYLHKKWTGVGNELILSNLKALAENGSQINIRIPLIAAVNDSEQNIDASAKFISSLAGEKKKVNILPYHNIAKQKYAKLGIFYNSQNLQEPSQNEMQRIVNHFAAYGIEASAGG